MSEYQYYEFLAIDRTLTGIQRRSRVLASKRGSTAEAAEERGESRSKLGVTDCGFA